MSATKIAGVWSARKAILWTSSLMPRLRYQSGRERTSEVATERTPRPSLARQRARCALLSEQSQGSVTPLSRTITPRLDPPLAPALLTHQLSDPVQTSHGNYLMFGRYRPTVAVKPKKRGLLSTRKIAARVQTIEVGSLTGAKLVPFRHVT